MKEIIKDYLWFDKFDNIDNFKLYKTCVNVEERLKEEFQNINDPLYDGFGSFSTYYHREYNLFTFPCTELHKLYTNLCNCFDGVLEKKYYYIRCWVNLFDKNKNIDWHKHWDSCDNTYHGYYCVNTEGINESYTEYKVPNYNDTYKIISKNGLCVLGKSDGDEHRSSVWLNDGYRVTIAFDIIPAETIRISDKFTHKLLHNYFVFNKMASSTVGSCA